MQGLIWEPNKFSITKQILRINYKNRPTIFGGIRSSDDLVPLIVTPQACTPGIPWFPFIPGFPALPLGPAIPVREQIKLNPNSRHRHT